MLLYTLFGVLLNWKVRTVANCYGQCKKMHFLAKSKFGRFFVHLTIKLNVATETPPSPTSLMIIRELNFMGTTGPYHKMKQL